jgi:hypothetical protein
MVLAVGVFLGVSLIAGAITIVQALFFGASKPGEYRVTFLGIVYLLLTLALIQQLTLHGFHKATTLGG